MTWLGEVRVAIRSLVHRPGWSLAAVATLALGIGATTSIWSLVDGVLLRPLPYPDADRIVAVKQVSPATGAVDDVTSYPLYQGWMERQDVLDGFGAYATTRATLAGDDGAEDLRAGYITAGALAALGTAPELGRWFTAEEDAEGGPSVVLLSHELWVTRFGARRDVVGRTIELNERSRTVVGVMPADFAVPDPDVALWLSTATAYRGASTWYVQMLGRLPDDVSLETARAGLARVRQTPPGDDASEERALTAMPLRSEVVGDARSPILVFFGAVLVLLLVAAFNVANLLLVRAADRERELTVRAALGASRRRLVGMHVLEGLLLAAVASLGGWVLAQLMTDTLLALAPDLPRLEEVSLDRGVLSFGIGLAVLVGLAVGIVPGVMASRPELARGLKGGRGVTGSSGSRLRAGLVVAQVALATLLVGAGGLLVRSFLELWSTDPGFATRNVVRVTVPTPGSRYGDYQARRVFYAELMERLERDPGVARAAATSFFPFGFGRSIFDLAIDGRPSLEGPAAGTETLYVTPGYFDVMGIPITAGRALTANDDDRAAPVVVIDQTLARRHWPDGDAVGSRIRLEDETWRTIAGVVAAVHQHGPQAEPTPLVYVPYAQAADKWPFGMGIVLQTTAGLDRVAPLVRRTVAALDPLVPVSSIGTLETSLSASIAAPRFRAWLLGAFALAALLLAGIGVYGLSAYSAARRTREVGIRMALGASRNDVVRAMLRRGAALTGGGVLLGLAATLAASRLVQGYLHGVAPTDPLTLAGGASILLAVGLLAAFLPARRASRLDPVRALRTE